MPRGLLNGRIVFFGFFVVGSDFFVELCEDALVLRVPGCLCGISVFGARRVHGRDAELFEDGIVVVVVRRKGADEFLGDRGLAVCDLLGRERADLFVGRRFIDGFKSYLAVIRAVAAAEIAEFAGGKYLSLFFVPLLIDKNLGRIVVALGDDALCRKGGVLVPHDGRGDGHISLCFDARAVVL